MSQYKATPALERAICALAPPHYATSEAPATWGALRAWYENWQDKARAYGTCFVLPVYDGGCDNTIYSSPQVNHAFRAWHDHTHLRLIRGFDFESELAVAREHVRQLRRAGVSRDDRRAVWCDTAGQIEYYRVNGEYVVNQAAFVAECIAQGISAAVAGLTIDKG